ncbi:hypothetical protein METBIDRAFT_155156 [Metschnikowia bicuspidata var. bicuspidata NRRL YB-4993]|uniref:Uncharacterized protein n=1 Tax=Metschnikowia bicuspidata var. bicuspidata NRRL YB-4993 TaxID=869754 RepID=A0A1A0HEW0_9ASCO|nr:hypothetical protein METBIDRAFT_155156 [Metschnikowia bicuspidata var. bicuspidata NRRL YB-4993]OBA22536.1 hypothetical protein METBIDRAFT_155156 [Metschnikowia bicuspidata var. bicuspidata NRRL YB-4993]
MYIFLVVRNLPPSNIVFHRLVICVYTFCAPLSCTPYYFSKRTVLVYFVLVCFLKTRCNHLSLSIQSYRVLQAISKIMRSSRIHLLPFQKQCKHRTTRRQRNRSSGIVIQGYDRYT